MNFEAFEEKNEWIVAGLGNPGMTYAKTWHNCGYMAAEMLSQKLGVRVNKAKFKSAYGESFYKGIKIHILKPETYMNLSGRAIRDAAEYYKIPPTRILVFFDEIDLPLGTVRLRMKGSSGTHNGMKSVIYELGSENFPRIRFGFGPLPEHIDLRTYVLSKVGGNEEKELFSALDRGTDAALILISGNVDEAMRTVALS